MMAQSLEPCRPNPGRCANNAGDTGDCGPGYDQCGNDVRRVVVAKGWLPGRRVAVHVRLIMWSSLCG